MNDRNRITVYLSPSSRAIVDEIVAAHSRRGLRLSVSAAIAHCLNVGRASALREADVVIDNKIATLRRQLEELKGRRGGRK